MTEHAQPFQLALPLFEGSLDQLVRMVGERKLAAEDVPVAAVAAQLQAFIASTDELELEEVGQLVAYAAYLAAVKSKGVLAVPIAEEFEDITDRDSISLSPSVGSAEWLAALQGFESYPVSSPSLTLEQEVEPRSVEDLQQALAGIAERREQEPARVAVPGFVRVEVAISRLIRRLRSMTKLSLRSLLKGASRNDAVVHFLAVLELVRTRRAVVTQESVFDDITIEPLGDAEDAATRAG